MGITVSFTTDYGAEVSIPCETPEDAAQVVEDAQEIGVVDAHVECQN